MNSEELAQAIICGRYTERSADALVRDHERLQNARFTYESMIADLEWSYYRQPAEGRESTLEMFIQLGLHDELYARLGKAVTDTLRAEAVLESKKHNEYPWSLVCEECLHVLTDTYDTWQAADKQRTHMLYTLHDTEEGNSKCIYTLKIMPTHIARSYAGK